jgi:ABC-type antimicrobial peptide transport system ATPase subunit
MLAQTLAVRNLTKTYRARRWFSRESAEVRALDDVSFELEAGATLAVIGASFWHDERLRIRASSKAREQFNC